MLLSFAHTTVPGLSHQAMLRLDFGQELDETDQLATLNLLATGQARRLYEGIDRINHLYLEENMV